jgi:hypothetical protein
MTPDLATAGHSFVPLRTIDSHNTDQRLIITAIGYLFFCFLYNNYM